MHTQKNRKEKNRGKREKIIFKNCYKRVDTINSMVDPSNFSAKVLNINDINKDP